LSTFSAAQQPAVPAAAPAVTDAKAANSEAPQAAPKSSSDTAAAPQPEAETIEQAQTLLRTAEAKYPGNSEQVAEAILVLLELQVEAVPATDELLNEAKRAMAMGEAVAGKESPIYVKAMADEAWVYLRMDRADLARPVAEDALAIAQKIGNDESIAVTAAALGNICYLQNAEISVKAIRTVKDTPPIDLVSYMLDLNESRRRSGDIAGATATMAEILDIAAKENAKHKEVGQRWASVENDAGAFYSLIRKYDDATLHLEKAVDLDTQAYGPESSALHSALTNLAFVQLSAGMTDQSLKTYERARQLSLKMFGPNHSLMAHVESGYASALNFVGRYQDAADMAIDSHRTEREHLSLAIRLMPERQALTLADEGVISFNIMSSLAVLHPEIRIADIYQEAVRSRALVAEEMAQRAAGLSRKSDPAVEALMKQMDAERKAVMDMQGSSGSSAQALSEATAKMEHTERELAARSVQFRGGERERSSNLEDLRKNLPTQSVLISYFRYTQYKMRTDKFISTWTPSYLAFVLHPGSATVSVHDLGDAKTIDALIGRMRASADSEAHAGGLGAARNEREYRQAGEQLRKLIWDPLESELKDTKMALIVPDGVLNLIPFSALPVGDGYLVEHGPVVHILTSERDLLPAAVTAKKTGLLAVGSPSFELTELVSGPNTLREAPIKCGAFTEMEFHALPGSLNEVQEISSTFKRWNTREPEQLLTGKDATRARFLDAAPQSRILHVATHAFVLDKSCGNGNPLLHSGLVFAGANKSRSTSILTAQEIASLNLSGVDWAVLSACNTGNGELKDGEGVLGLERSFRVAGARSVVMALWPVDDQVTREFMRGLYGERFGRHVTTADAVWTSARTVLKARQFAGQSTHPWYWAGFVGAGAWQ
jgi:CHAT domain-containing protein